MFVTSVLQQIHQSQILRSVLPVLCVHKNEFVKHVCLDKKMVSMALSCLPGGLNGELVMDIANRKSLTIDCTDRDAPFLLRNSGQLGDVGGAL